MIPTELHLENRYYYKRLEEDQKEFYVFLVELFLSGRRRFYFKQMQHLFKDEMDELMLSIFADDVDEYRLPTAENPNERVSDLPAFEKTVGDNPHGGFVQLAIVMEAILRDWPEFYFLYRALDWDKNGVVRVGDEVFSYTKEEILQLNRKLEDILHRFDGIDDDFELELAVHDFITESYDYDLTKFPDDYELDKNCCEMFTLVGLLRKGEAVCSAFSRMAQFILQRKGKEVAYIEAEGMGPDPSEGHAWLLVKVEGEWYHLDVTFNESRTKDKQRPQYIYFNITDEESALTHVLGKNNYPDIACTATSANYYVKKGLYFVTDDEIADGVKELLDGIDCEGTKHLYFRTLIEKGEEEVLKCIKKGMAKSKTKLAGEDFIYCVDDGYWAVTVEVEK